MRELIPPTRVDLSKADELDLWVARVHESEAQSPFTRWVKVRPMMQLRFIWILVDVRKLPAPKESAAAQSRGPAGRPL